MEIIRSAQRTANLSLRSLAPVLDVQIKKRKNQGKTFPHIDIYESFLLRSANASRGIFGRSGSHETGAGSKDQNQAVQSNHLVDGQLPQKRKKKKKKLKEPPGVQTSQQGLKVKPCLPFHLWYTDDLDGPLINMPESFLGCLPHLWQLFRESSTKNSRNYYISLFSDSKQLYQTGRKLYSSTLT